MSTPYLWCKLCLVLTLAFPVQVVWPPKARLRQRTGWPQDHQNLRSPGCRLGKTTVNVKTHWKDHNPSSEMIPPHQLLSESEDIISPNQKDKSSSQVLGLADTLIFTIETQGETLPYMQNTWAGYDAATL